MENDLIMQARIDSQEELTRDILAAVLSTCVRHGNDPDINAVVCSAFVHAANKLTKTSWPRFSFAVCAGLLRDK